MDLAKESLFLLEKHVSPYGWIMIAFHIAISAGNILILQSRNWKCLLATLWTKEIHCSPTKSFAKQAGCFILKDTSKSKDMTGLMDIAIAKVNQNELDMRSFSTQLMVYLKTTGHSLTTHCYMKSKLKIVFTWAVTI